MPAHRDRCCSLARPLAAVSLLLPGACYAHVALPRQTPQGQCPGRHQRRYLDQYQAVGTNDLLVAATVLRRSSYRFRRGTCYAPSAAVAAIDQFTQQCLGTLIDAPNADLESAKRFALLIQGYTALYTVRRMIAFCQDAQQNRNQTLAEQRPASKEGMKAILLAH